MSIGFLLMLLYLQLFLNILSSLQISRTKVIAYIIYYWLGLFLSSELQGHSSRYIHLMSENITCATAIINILQYFVILL